MIHLCNYPNCNKQYSRNDALKRHNNDKHLKTSQRSCPVCGRIIQSRTTLNRHMRKVHHIDLREKPKDDDYEQSPKHNPKTNEFKDLKQSTTFAAGNSNPQSAEAAANSGKSSSVEIPGQGTLLDLLQQVDKKFELPTL